MTRQYYEHYRKPVMHTETNTFNEKDAECWLWKQWVNVMRIRMDGVPVVGFTWYSLLDQVDWDSSLAEKLGTINPCGLFDLDRKIRTVGESYKMMLQEFGQITMVPYGEMFEITRRPAELKVEV